MLFPLSRALAPADTKSPYWTVMDAKEERREGQCGQTFDYMEKEWKEEKDAVRMEM